MALLKVNGKLCYIIPQTVLVNSDLDVIRYHLSKFTTIEKIVTFKGKMFVDRGLKQKREIPTSSLIFVVSKVVPNPDHHVEIINYQNSEDNIETVLDNINKGVNIEKKQISQALLSKNVINWIFVKQNTLISDLLEEYKKNTDEFSIYYEHSRAMLKFGSKFFFDKGLVFPKACVHSTINSSDEEFELIKLDEERYSVLTIDKSVNSKDIRIPQGSQGLALYKLKYKIVWGYMNFNHFYFSDKQIILPYNFVLISSDNKKEILYLFSILNSSLQKYIIENNFKLEQEDKLKILLGIKLIKNQIRVPKIDKTNQFIKDEIIKSTEKLLSLEEKTVEDFVDFSSTLLQKVDNIEIIKNHLFLIKDGQQISLLINKNQELIRKVLNTHFGNDNILPISIKERISIRELRKIPVIDIERRNELKNYIDDLVFALYFQIPLKEIKLEKSEIIRKKCLQNQYYGLINKDKSLS